MRQNQSNQTTTPSENNSIRLVDEQELQAISGGCVGCSLVAAVSAHLTSNAATQALRTGALKDLTKNANYMNVFQKTAPTASTETSACENCIGGLKDLVKTIIKR